MRELGLILLAEDDEQDVELTLAALAENNLANEVKVVHDGAEALDYLYKQGVYENRTERDPSVLLLDIKMPKVNGLQVLEKIKGDQKFKMLPVVMLTSSREEKDISTCYKLGVNAYVVKPVEYNDFMKAIKEVGLFWAIINEPPVRGIV